MARKDTPRQPSSLERKQQSERDKKVGLFRKTKKQPEKKKETKPKTRIAEFDFDPRWSPQPGQIIQMSRQSGKSLMQYEAMKELMRRGIPMPEFRAEYTPPQPNPFGDWRKPVDDAKLNFCIEMIHKKHGVRIEYQQGRGDYVEFFSRGDRIRYRLSMTQVHTMDVGKMVDLIEAKFGLSNSRVKTNDSSGFEKAKNPTESWAEKWARENA